MAVKVGRKQIRPDLAAPMLSPFMATDRAFAWVSRGTKGREFRARNDDGASELGMMLA
ncbi:hypothetical protein [Mesorhizobium sp. WSM2561]|uniref:hypothetical protein n=1 Tax=Mesorhizobium sp. WSM2561 TaxID=1040985 RepID=UPI0004AF638E|nr:hypothetical protein [Mesorhizobium sp. WSM2561]